MPWSSTEGKPEALSHVMRHTPPDARILDVGAGGGTYGRMLRRAGYSQIEALELFEPYIGRYGLRDIYAQVHVGDIRTFTANRPYDLMILGDVFEHISPQDAQALVRRLPALCLRALFSVPWQYAQGPLEGNDAEVHLQPDLTPEVMLTRFPSLMPLRVGQAIGLYAWSITEDP